MRLVIIALLVCSITWPAEAAPSTTYSGSRNAPANVLAQMKSGGRSIRFQQIDVGPGQGQIFCQIYNVGEKYFLDLFRSGSAETFHRLNSIDLGDTPHSNALDVSFKWLQPKQWRGPILLLYDRDFPGDWDGSWDLLVFPDGFSGHVIRQSFLEKFVGSTIIHPSFDSYDERGLLIITSWYGDGGIAWGTYLYWNGHSFVERKPRYVLIGPMFKSYSQVQAFVDSHNFGDYENLLVKPQVHPSHYYSAKGLRPGLLVIVLGYFGIEQDAMHAANKLHQEGIECSTLRLY